MTEGKFIAYYRVSTDKQGVSGLGIAAQRRAVEDYLNGGSWELIEEYTEVESGRRAARPELQEALKLCKKQKATLVVAKLDRLSRDAHFLLGLQKAKVDFIAVDMPSANRMTIGIMALVAEEESRMIAQRTKAAIAIAREEKNVEWGTYGRDVLSKKNKKKADQFAIQMMPIIEEIRESGITTLRAIAEELNNRAVSAYRKGSKWHKDTVDKLIKRIEKLRCIGECNGSGAGTENYSSC